MTARAIDLDVVTVQGRRVRADVADAVVEMSVSFDVGTVPELTLTLLDPGLRLGRGDVVDLGSVLTVDGARWQVGAVDRTYAAHGALVTVRARSALSKRLRALKKTGATKGRTVREWLTRLAKDADGKAVVQNGPKLRSVTISNGQTALDAIGAVTSAANMSWCEHDGTIYAGTPYWAWQGGTGLPTWPLTWLESPRSDVVELSTVLTDDDREQRGTATLAVDQSVGARIRPWHLIQLSGTGGDEDGRWLVTGVEYPVDGTSLVTVNAHQPRRSKPKAGGTADTESGQTEAASPGAGLDGSTTTAPGLNPTRSFAAAVAWAEGQMVNPTPSVGGKPTWAHYCQTFARCCVDADPFGDSALSAFYGIPAQYKSSSSPPPPGSIAYYNTGPDGHAVFVGLGGMVYSTSNTTRIIKVPWTYFGSYLGYITRTPSGDLPIQVPA